MTSHSLTGPIPHWRDDAWADRFPRLSLNERDRRFRLARTLMEERDLECLVLASPAHSHDFLGHYFAGEARPTVVLPREGEPVAFQDDVTSPTAHRDLAISRELGDRWIADWRINEGARGIAGLIEDLGLAGARIGRTGHEVMWPTSSYILNGGAPWNRLPLAHRLSSLLPRATWVDIWADLLPLISVKSGEEIEQFTKAAHLADRATEIFYDSLRVGGTQAEAMARAVYDIFEHGGYSPAAGTPFTSVRPIGRGDVVNSEIIVYAGTMEAQAGLTACMGPASRSMRELIDAAHESYDLGRDAVRPGLTLRELQEAMAVPFRRIGAWSTPPLFHGLNPIFTQADVGRPNEEELPGLRARFFPDLEGPLPYKPVFGPDTELVPGMTVHLEPNGQKGTDMVFLGGGLLVTEAGAEEFAASSRRARLLDAGPA